MIDSSIEILEDHISNENLPETESKISSFKDIIDSIDINKSSVIKFNVRRNHVFSDFCLKLKQPWMKNKHQYSMCVRYVGEQGIDHGGLRREFFSEAFQDIKKQLFTKTDNGFVPNSTLLDDLANGYFRHVGILFSYSICLCGPAPNFLAQWVYSYITGGTEKVLKNLPNNLSDTPYSSTYNKIHSIETVSKLQEFCTSDDGLDLLSDIRFRGVPRMVDMSSKEVILRSIFMKDILQAAIPFIQEIKDGLQQYNLIKEVIANPNTFQVLFCPSEDEFVWTFEKLEEIIVPVYQQDQSTRKACEINTFKALLDALETFFHCGADGDIMFPDLMKFITGSQTIPPLGLPTKIKVEFYHCCPKNCRCKPTVSTCDLTLNIATHYTSADDIILVFKDAIQMSRGFDDL